MHVVLDNNKLNAPLVQPTAIMGQRFTEENSKTCWNHTEKYSVEEPSIDFNEINIVIAWVTKEREKKHTIKSKVKKLLRLKFKNRK